MRVRRHACDVALDVYNQPAKLRSLTAKRFPEGMLDVIKAAAGHKETLEVLAQQSGVEAEDIRQASDFFVQQILINNQGDPVRMLGLNVGFDSKDVQNHRRWLLRWLHPDLNKNVWQSKLFDRVSSASDALQQRLDMHSASELSPNVEDTTITVPRRSHLKNRRSWSQTRFRHRNLIWGHLIKNLALKLAGLVVVILVIYLVTALALSKSSSFVENSTPIHLVSPDQEGFRS